jgi:4'-phosphopantetheinyl transferase
LPAARLSPAPISNSLPPVARSLPDDEVHVWHADLDRLPAGIWGSRAHSRSFPSCELLLEPSEREHAARFRFPRDRQRFIACHALLRLILASYTGRPPEALRFAYGQFGKPSLAPKSGGSQLCFNLAHSDGLALYAVARQREVGVDVERIFPDVVTGGLVEKLFCHSERLAFQALPESARCKAFFDCWTRKEACLKAMGVGLQVEPGSFAAPRDREELGALWQGSATRWSVQTFEPAAGFAAAVSAEGGGWSARLRRWR